MARASNRAILLRIVLSIPIAELKGRLEEVPVNFLVIAQHPPDLCPLSNGEIRAIAKETAKEIPALTKKLGIQVTANYVTRTNHLVILAMEADDITKVRDLLEASRIEMWNTCDVYATSTLEEALASVDQYPPIF
jgi:uncharacterized protein with GYD domain